VAERRAVDVRPHYDAVLKRWVEFKRPRETRKIKQSDDAESVGTFLGHGALVLREKERRQTFPDRRLHLEKFLLSFRGEGQYVVTGTIPIFLRHPSHPIGQIQPSQGAEGRALVQENALLALQAERAITCVPEGGIKLPDKALQRGR